MKWRSLAAGMIALALALAPAAAKAEDVDISVTIPSASAGGARDLSDAVLSWGINPEAGSGAFFGGCNFLSAGKAGNSGASRVWLESDGLFRATDGNVSIEKPTANNAYRQSTFANRCLDERGEKSRTVTTAGDDYGTGNRFVITNGVGTIDPSKGTASIRWKGSVTVIAYGGLTYFWLSDPVLTARDGGATLTATLGGYAASREDASVWAPLTERTVTLANLASVELSGEYGLSVTPQYRGVTVTPAAGGATQLREGVDWGSFPQSYVDFQDDVGQAGYWYSTGGMRDFAKPPYPISVSWSAAERVDDTPPVDEPRGGDTGGQGNSPTSTDPTSSATASTTGGTTAGAANSSSPNSLVAPTVDPAATGVDGYQATTPDALQSVVRGLIPAVAAALEDPRAWLVIASSALVALAAIAFVGFRRRWLILPWSRKADHS